MPFDKSIWPCYTPDLFWALSDDITRCGILKVVEDDAVEYEIQTRDLPDGRIGLWRFNALRNISVDLSAWPQKLRAKIQTATLCLGDKALEEVIRGPHNPEEDDSIQFTMFTGDSILPLFVVDEDPLLVRLIFRPALTDNERLLVPSKAIDASGLLVKITDKKPFFVAGCSDSILTWDGAQSRVISKHLIDKQDTVSTMSAETESDTEKVLIDPIARWKAVNNDESTFEDMWSGLQTAEDIETGRLSQSASELADLNNSTTFFMPTPRD